MLDWYEKAEKPKENIELVTAILQRLSNYSEMLKLKEINRLPYMMLEVALGEVVNEWKK